MSSDESPLDETTRTVTLSKPVVERVEARLHRTDFDSADEYVDFVLREVLTRVEAESDEAYDGIDESEVESRLESLGYMQ